MSGTFINNDLIIALKEIIRRTNDMKKQIGGSDSISSSISSAGHTKNSISSASTLSSDSHQPHKKSKLATKNSNNMSSDSHKVHKKSNLAAKSSSISSDSHRQLDKKSNLAAKKNNEISSDSSFFTEDTPKKRVIKDKKRPSTTLSDISSDSISSQSFGQKGGVLDPKKEKEMLAELDRMLK
jgi:hypothetical protein